MKKIMLVALILFPVATLGAGWDYYVLNEDGNWEEISPRELDLSTPGRFESAAVNTGGGEQRRIMILYNRPKPEPKSRQVLNWIQQVGSDLVEQVE